VLTNDFDYIIDSDLTINAGVSLIIEKGTRLLFGDKINLFVEGNLTVNGTFIEPVLFSSNDFTKPWGGIIINHSNATDTSKLYNAFFVNGGGNGDYVFGHSQSQAVIKVEYSNLLVDNCYFMDNPGKCFGSTLSNLKIVDSYLTRSDTGGEFAQSVVFAKSVYVTDIPDNDYVIADDDNDAFYFNATHTSGLTSVIDSCVFFTGEDDGIDHNGAILQIRNCRVEDFNHEGVAASNNNSVALYNSLIKNCEQGVEAGYGNPSVSIEHCVIIDNDTGVRFGDSYNWGCTGEINLINSIVYNNNDNILNYDLLTMAAVPDAINVSYTMTNDEEYDESPYCLIGTPLFDSRYFLLPNSPGKGLASTGVDIGLYNPFSKVEANIFGDSCFNVYPNPASDFTHIHYYLKKQSDVKIVLRSITGNEIAVLADLVSDSGNCSFVFNASEFSTGIYLVSLYVDNVQTGTLKMFVR